MLWTARSLQGICHEDGQCHLEMVRAGNWKAQSHALRHSRPCDSGAQPSDTTTVGTRPLKLLAEIVDKGGRLTGKTQLLANVRLTLMRLVRDRRDNRHRNASGRLCRTRRNGEPSTLGTGSGSGGASRPLPKQHSSRRSTMIKVKASPLMTHACNPHTFPFPLGNTTWSSGCRLTGGGASRPSRRTCGRPHDGLDNFKIAMIPMPKFRSVGRPRDFR